MFIFAVYFVHVTKKIAVRTLHIRAKPPAVSLLAAMSAFVVRTSAISMRTMAEVPARFAHRIIADDMYLVSIIVVIVVIFVVVIINIDLANAAANLHPR